MSHVWTWDFIFDRTTKGLTLKWLSIIDEFTRRCITLDVGRRTTSEDVINHLAELFAIYGVPECIRSDNGPEFVSHAIKKWGSSGLLVANSRRKQIEFPTAEEDSRSVVVERMEASGV